MSFFVSRIIIKNRAPFDSIDLSFRDNSISVLTALNGKGKTTILSYIVDAWGELTKTAFQNSYEGRENKYYRVSSPLYDIKPGEPSLVYIRFIDGIHSCDYIDIRNGCPEEFYFSSVQLEDKIPYQKIKNKLSKGQTFKLINDEYSKKDVITKVFNNNITTFFPSYRFELPNYLNDCYQQDITHKLESGYNGYLNNPFEVTSDIKAIANWILDVVLDQKVNEEEKRLPDGNIVRIAAPEQQVWLNAKKILENSLISKFPKRNVRFGIGRRTNSGSRLAIMETIPNGSAIQYCPTIFNLSSGELSIIAIFAEILRRSDDTFGMIPMEQFKGIVLIDEVDKHLHIQLQKEVLPLLFNLFPNIQFIVSSHSPFLNMGLAELSLERTTIYDLDNNGLETTPTNNEVYQAAYESFLNERNKYASELEELKKQVESIQKALVITEGKTDIKHIKKAIEKLGYNLSFDTIPEVNQPDGYSNLDKMIQELSKVKHEHKIVAIFDRDVPEILKKYPDPYKDLGNNVFAMCIACPQTRINEGRESISIEYLYSDDEIHSLLPDGTKLFFGNEFEDTSVRRHKIDRTLRLSLKDGCGKDRILENNGSQAVYDNDDNNHLAKKNSFAEAVINDQIMISDASWENFRLIIDTLHSIISQA